MHLQRTPLAAALAIASIACAQQRAADPFLPSSAPDLPRQISAFVREVFQDKSGCFWFGTNGEGVCRYDGQTLEYFSIDEGFGGTAVRGILQDPDGAMWFATDGGVTRLHAGAFTNFTTAHGLSDNSVWSLLLDRSGAIWAGTHRGVCRFDGQAFTPFPLPRVQVENPESRFTPDVVFSMLEDRAGNLWFGTDGEGVHKFDGSAFTSLTTAQGLAGNMVRSLREDRDGRIWIGTDGGGVSRLDSAELRTFTTADGLGSDRVYEIVEDSAGNMWFSTLGAGACRYDGASFTPFGVEQGLTINDLWCACGAGRLAKDCHGPGPAHVQEIFEDKDGILWFGCSGGLFRLENETFINVTREGPWPDAAAPSPSP